MMKLVHQLSTVNASKNRKEEEEHLGVDFSIKQTKINLHQLHAYHISLPYFNDVPSLPSLFFFVFFLFIHFYPLH